MPRNSVNDFEFINLLKLHSGKWYEVCIISTDDINEKPEVIAKFLSSKDCSDFADMYKTNHAGFTKLIIR